MCQLQVLQQGLARQDARLDAACLQLQVRQVVCVCEKGRKTEISTLLTLTPLYGNITWQDRCRWLHAR
jgi:hypothetical protein